MSLNFVRVGDLSDQIRGVSYGKEDASKNPLDGYLPVLRAGNITDNGLVFSDLVYVPAAKVSSKQKLRAGDIVIAASSGSLDVVGKAAPSLNDFDGGFGAFCKVMRPNEKVDAKYLAQFFKTPEYRKKISALAEGANINNLRNEHLDELLVPLPSLSEQRRIAAILDQADALRAKRREALAQLDNLAQSFFIEMFGDPATNPKNWVVNSVANFTLSVTNGMTRRRNEGEEGTDIVLRLRDIRSGWIDFSDVNRITLSPSESNKFSVFSGDLLFIRVNGNPDYVGRCAVFNGHSEPVFFNDHIMRVKVDHTRIHSVFLEFLLNGNHGKNEIAKHRKTSAGQHTINQDGLGKIQVPTPPVELQAEFVHCLERIGKQKMLFRDSFDELDALFASLQHRAFRGEL